MGGWVKIHRKLLDNPVACKDADHLYVWMYLLLKATHEGISAMFKGEKIVLEPGQLITGRKKIALQTGVEESKVKRILELFKSDQQIERVSTNQNSLITIVNWSKYQLYESQSDQQMTNERPTDDQPVTTNKNVKKEKKEKKEIIVSKDTIRQTDVQRVIETWNQLEGYGIKPIKKLSPSAKRYSNLLARIREYSLEEVLQAVEKIKDSSFLQGRTKTAWVITFDWFVLPSNFPKVADGNYDDKANNPGSSSPSGNEIWQ